MRCGAFARLRVLALLVAFGIGLLGQTIMAVAMSMPMQMPQDAPKVMAVDRSADTLGKCQGCVQQQDVPATPTMGANCTFALCSVLPALLPSSGPIAAPPIRVSIQPTADDRDKGITLRPDLGPPKTILHS